MTNENHIGFERKLRELVDTSKIKDILSLIPSSVILPMFYKGDTAFNKQLNRDIVITKNGWKNGEHIYYFINDDDEVYDYESNFKF